jgi:hypothetical protein
LSLTVNGKTKPPTIPYGKTVTVKGTLHCGPVPVRGARILIATTGGPSRAAINSAVQSAQDGSFSYKVPKGPDRKLQFSYTAYSNDPRPSATATATIQVRPNKLRISTSLSNGFLFLIPTNACATGQSRPKGCVALRATTHSIGTPVEARGSHSMG